MEQTPKTRVDERDLARFLEASEEFFAKGTCSVQCDKCQQPIAFKKLGPEAWQHWCKCSKFNGTLKGL